MRPRNLWTFVAVVGVGQLMMQSVFQGSRVIPDLVRICPKKATSVANNKDLDELQYRLAWCRALSTLVML